VLWARARLPGPAPLRPRGSSQGGAARPLPARSDRAGAALRLQHSAEFSYRALPPDTKADILLGSFAGNASPETSGPFMVGNANRARCLRRDDRGPPDHSSTTTQIRQTTHPKSRFAAS
jgi:hypothetical protein